MQTEVGWSLAIIYSVLFTSWMRRGIGVVPWLYWMQEALSASVVDTVASAHPSAAGPAQGAGACSLGINGAVGNIGRVPVAVPCWWGFVWAMGFTPADFWKKDIGLVLGCCTGARCPRTLRKLVPHVGSMDLLVRVGGAVGVLQQGWAWLPPWCLPEERAARSYWHVVCAAHLWCFLLPVHGI